MGPHRSKHLVSRATENVDQLVKRKSAAVPVFEGSMNSSHTQWLLVSNCGDSIPLPQTMISLGRENCDVLLQSRSVDNRHAVITYDHYEKRFKVKDLNSINGTYLNNARIPSHTFVKVEHLDTLRFGFVIYQAQAVEHFASGVLVAAADWSHRHCPSSLKMAECQGCLQKQNLHHHTCGIKKPDWNTCPPPPPPIPPPFQITDANSSTSPASVVPPPPPPPSSQTAALTTNRQDHCGNPVVLQVATNQQWKNYSPPLLSAAIENKKNCCNTQTVLTPTPPSSRHQCFCGGSQIIPSSCRCLIVSSAVAPLPPPPPAPAPAKISSSPALNFHRPGVCNSSDTGSNSPHSNCSRDSLDFADSMIKQQQQLAEVAETPLAKGGFVDKSLAAEASSKNVVKAEKPYVSQANSLNGGHSKAFQMNERDKRAIISSSCAPPAPPRTAVPTDDGKSRLSCSTAFTVDFHDEPKSAAAAAKKLDIKDSISKFAPPKAAAEVEKPSSGGGQQRRISKVDELQASDTFSDENGNVDGKDSSPEENCKKGLSDSEGADCVVQPVVNPARLRLAAHRAGYLSEGHVSSDHDDDYSAKSDPARKGGRNLESDRLVGDAEKSAKKGSARNSLPALGLKDSATYLINKMFGEMSAPPTSPTEPQPPPKEQQQQLTKNDAKSGSHNSLTSTTTYTVVNGRSHTLPSRAKYEQQLGELYLSEEDDEDVEDDAASADDAVRDDVCSESGTYTIEKDSIDGRDEAEARLNIDNVFGVKIKCDVPLLLEDEDLKGVELRCKSAARDVPDRKSKGDTNSRKVTPSWLKDWVAQTSSGHCRTGSPSGASVDKSVADCPAPVRPTSVPVSSSATTPNIPPRQRRKLPVPPVDRPSVKPRPGDSPLDNKQVAKSSSSSQRTSPDGRRSDSSMDTETILRETETVVSAMEARMGGGGGKQQHQAARVPIVSSSLESRDSGGESDLDTSTASPVNECEVGGVGQPNVSKRLSLQLKSHLRMLDGGGGQSPGVFLSTTTTKDGSSSQGRNTPTGGGGGDVSEVETASINSDMSSSSDLSRSSPGMKRKGVGGGERQPAMRFNRAFSLRRARLGCDADSGPPPQSATTTTTTKKASVVVPVSSRPSSAGSVGSGKEQQRGHGHHHVRRSSASHKSDSGASAVSPAGVAAPVVSPSSGGGGGSSGYFSRNDGGRFSLRLPKSAPPPSKPPPIKSAAAAAKSKPPSSSSSKGSSSRMSAAVVVGRAAPPNARSNSTLSAKELEMKNWKRRKEYDPLKAAAEGRRKQQATTTTTTHKSGPVLLASSMHIPKGDDDDESPTAAFHRSASFHGTDSLAVKSRRETFTCEDDLLGHDDDGGGTSPIDDDGPVAIPSYDKSEAFYRSPRFKKDYKQCEMILESSEDDSASEATRALSHTDLQASSDVNPSTRSCSSSGLHPALRHKSKIDALDNLVISTVHQLSCNLRRTTGNILRKVGDLYSPECEQVFGSSGLEDLLEKLGRVESPVSSPQGRTVSKQLAGILKNMKRLEESLQSIDRVMDLVPALNGSERKCNGSGVTDHHHDKMPSGRHSQKWNGFEGREYY